MTKARKLLIYGVGSFVVAYMVLGAMKFADYLNSLIFTQ